MNRTKLDAWCIGVIEASWLAALTLAPLFFNVFSSRVFEPDKISLIRTLALVILVAWIVRWVNSGRLWLPAGPSDIGPSDIDGELPRRTPFLLPIGLLVFAYLVSTVFSVAPFVSWFGSYQRLQGTYSFLAYVVIALALMAHLRNAEQIRRLRHVIIITSLPIAIYGILQRNGLDPLPWGGDVQRRVTANAGNAIFLAAYLLMAFFFTLERVFSSFAHLLRKEEETSDGASADGQDVPTALAGGAYLFVLMVQIGTIFLTQSRGPVLGLLAGMYLFVLLLFGALRPQHYRLWTASWAGLGVLGVIALIVMNTTGALNAVQRIESLERLSGLLDLESNTAQVRLNIWQGAADMVAPHAPIVQPDGSTDGLNLVRPLVGYGPETMWVAYNPFYPVTLAHYEARNASPDRSHNETWDALVITGWLGFAAYMWLFLAIFYWSLRWLGLLSGRRDQILFGLLLAIFSTLFVAIFYLFDGSWRFFGVALPAGMIMGLVVYITAAAFLHDAAPTRRIDFPRQVLLLTLLVTMVAHFVEIHFGIAIAATRVYFWAFTGLLLVVGMGWVRPEAYALTEEAAPGVDDEQAVPASQRKRPQSKRTQSESAPSPRLPITSATVLTDLLIFLTLVFTYTTNSTAAENPLAILRISVLHSDILDRPAILLLLAFTWLVAVTVGMTTESLRHRHAPPLGWWIRGYAAHALIVWGGWLLYGLYQSWRLIPGLAGTGLDEQLDLIAGHFAHFTWLIVFWTLAAATVYSWRTLRTPGVAHANRLVPSLAAGALATVAALFIISSVNIGLVRADVIYKQGQQFDAQRQWATSIELYRRALAARPTEDHYMLFLGRGLLERAKEAPADAPSRLGSEPTLNQILALDQATIAQLPQEDLLRAAQAVLLRAQAVNPLNTDHTANLARLYRTWAELTPDETAQQALLDRSIDMYDAAVTLSPNNVRLWNEKANAHLARGERELTEQIYLDNLAKDDLYDETYVLLADFYSRTDDNERVVELLETGIDKLAASPARRIRPSQQMYSYLSVAQARAGQLEAAIETNRTILEQRPKDVAALRNLAILLRDQGDATGDASLYVEGLLALDRALEAVNPNRVGDVTDLHRVALELNERLEDGDAMRRHYQAIYEVSGDVNALRNLYNLTIADEDWPAAAVVLDELMRVQPEDFNHPLAMAQVLQQLDQPADALIFAERALSLAPAEEEAAINELITVLRQAE